MNKERLLELADRLEAGKPLRQKIVLDGEHVLRRIGFNLSSWIDKYASPGQDRMGHDCRTTACIAGMTILMWGDEGDRYRLFNGQYILTQTTAANLLGLDIQQARALFIPSPGELGSSESVDTSNAWRKVGAVRTAKTIRHLVRTGEVDWKPRKRAA